ncbi:hypothetical protein GXW82_14510 [Streptacidiphilus sp. 4-A2]|nr:hypothetical protein [Streptacidiphilus sp. 4-A2]
MELDGVPHFGQSLSLAAQRARSVAEALRTALNGAGVDLPITLAPHVGNGPDSVGADQAVLVITPAAPPAG